MEKLWSSEKSDKSMDLLKSVKSEDLSKDLQVNLRISHQTVKDFSMNWMNKREIQSLIQIRIKQIDNLHSDLYCSVLRDPALRNKLHYSSERKVGQYEIVH